LYQLARHSIDAIYLSNAPDYLRPDGLESLAAGVRHAARPGARVYYLSLDDVCAFERSCVAVPFRRVRAVEERMRAADPVGLYRFLGVGICD
jgi:S-adenosylmethionine:diacylglycerol 3-amino-3-carboxypropyl transferase